MKVGIIGLEYAGKKSLFSLLTGIKKDGYQQAGQEIGIVNVPDERIDYLAEFYSTKKITYSKIEFYLIPSLKKDSQERRKALLEAKEMDMFAVIVRQFNDDNVFHPEGKIDFKRDYSIVKDELIFADLFFVDTRVERLENSMKSKKTDLSVKELELMKKIKVHLESGNYLNTYKFTVDELKFIRTYNLVTINPVFAVINCDEDKINTEFEIDNAVKAINMSIKIENEIQQLDVPAKKEFMDTLGIKESSLNRLIKFAYNYGDLISFITAGPSEVHSWTIKNGTTALKSAGVIHSDLERGFIRAEIVNFEDLKSAGSEAKAKETAKYHLEGKEYIVKDGDILDIRFNV